MNAKTEVERRKTNTGRILAYLKLNGQATNQELTRIGGFRYSARILELRKEGHKIVRHHVRGGLWSYEYLGHPDDDHKEQISIFGPDEATDTA